MTRTILRALLCGVLLACIVPAQGQQLQTSKVSRAIIHITPELADQLPGMEIDLSHGTLVPGKYFVTDLTSREIAHIRALGFEVEIQIEDVTEHYQTSYAHRSAISCPQHVYDYPVPQNFELGSMGGYLTYSELLDAMDLMQFFYPDIISIRRPAGNSVTYQGRPIFWVRISDNAETDEQEPEVLYTALHHAREPMSMMQMVYYMWYLLEGYGKDPEATYLLNNTELYFIPCVNPDGYVYNQLVAPDGGGSWRKNLRDNDNNGVFDENEDGVDINRNYGYQWGLDDEGSSGNPASQVYRGPAAFSEPETRAIRDFIQEHDIFMALNYHAFGNFFLYPWGYTEDQNPDLLTFENYGELMALDNGFKPGTSMETVGYPTNGCSDDWMYAEYGVYAMTTELGGEEDGFWPDEEKIIPLSQASLRNNLNLAHLPHQFATLATDAIGAFFTSRQGIIEVKVKNYGQDVGDMALTMLSLSPNLQIDGNILEVSMGSFDEHVYSLGYSLDPSTQAGDEFSYIILLDNGFFEIRDTIVTVLAGETIAFSEDGADDSDWLSVGTTWGVTEEDSHSGSTCLTDSPYGIYEADKESYMQIKDPIDLRNAIHAILEYWIKWEIEELIDYAQVQISTDGIFFESLCGHYTHPGSIFQVTEPVYDGVQTEWVKESIDLSPYLGNEVYIRFLLDTDGFQNLDGIYIDDLKVYVYAGEISATHGPDVSLDLQIWPNPVQDILWVQTQDLKNTSDVQWMSITDALGIEVTRSLLVNGDPVKVNTSAWPAGLYLVNIYSEGSLLKTKKFIRE